MSPLSLAPTAATPGVRFAPAEQHLSLEGDCYPENPRAFFAPLLGALAAYASGASGAPPAAFLADVHLRYVNSASTVALRQLFVELDRLASWGTRVEVRWMYDVDDDVGEELGKDLALVCTRARVEPVLLLG
jgi:hypothetical protein